MGIHVEYYIRKNPRWVRYDGERIETPGYRAIVADHRHFDREGMVYAYVEARRHAFVAWHELPTPGQLEDVQDGTWPDKKTAQRKAVEACIRDLDKNFETNLEREDE